MRFLRREPWPPGRKTSPPPSSRNGRCSGSDGDGVRHRFLRGEADLKDRIQTGFIIADHLPQALTDGAFVFTGDGEVDTGVFPCIPGVEDRLDEMFLQGGAAPLGIVDEISEGPWEGGRN